jgi:hypothetical protein
MAGDAGFVQCEIKRHIDCFPQKTKEKLAKDLEPHSVEFVASKPLI